METVSETMGKIRSALKDFTRKYGGYDPNKSRSANGLCKNPECHNRRRDGFNRGGIHSAYCQKCSDRYHKKKAEFENLFKPA